MRNYTSLILSFAVSVLVCPLFANAQNNKPAQARPDCSSLIANTPVLQEYDFFGPIPDPFNKPHRDIDYESSKAYAARVEAARRMHEEQSAKKMEGKTLTFKITAGEYMISYNPDRGGFEGLSQVHYKSRKDEKQVPYPTVVIPSTREARTRDIGFGAKSVAFNNYGLAIVKSMVKHPAASGAQHKFFFKFPVEKAKEVGKNARLAYVGTLNAPWSFSSYSAWTDFDSMKDVSLHTRYAAVNLLCAAVVDQRSNTILFQFK